MSPARTETDDADLAVRIGLRPQVSDRGRHVAHHLRIRDAAGGAHPCADVVGAARPVTEIEMGRDRRIAVVGELACNLDDPLVPARQVHDDHHSRHFPGTRRARVIGLAGIAVVTFERDDFGLQTLVRHALALPCVIAGTRPAQYHGQSRCKGVTATKESGG